MGGYCAPAQISSCCIVERAVDQRGVAGVPHARSAHRPRRFALPYFALGGTGHTRRQERASMMGRDSIWRNDHACGERLRLIIGPGKGGLTR